MRSLLDRMCGNILSEIQGGMTICLRFDMSEAMCKFMI